MMGITPERRWPRWALLAGVVGGVALIGRAFGPSTSAANPAEFTLRPAEVAIRLGGEGGQRPLAPGQPLPEEPGLSLGTLAGRGYRVQLLLTPAGPRYTVLDAAGSVLADALTPNELAATFPGLDVNGLLAQDQTGEGPITGPLMLAEPEPFFD